MREAPPGSAASLSPRSIIGKSEWIKCYAVIDRVEAARPELRFRREHKEQRDGSDVLAVVSLGDAAVSDEPDRGARPGHEKHLLRVLDQVSGVCYFLSLPSALVKTTWLAALEEALEGLDSKSSPQAESALSTTDGRRLRINMAPMSRTISDPGDSPDSERRQDSRELSPVARAIGSARGFASRVARALSPRRLSARRRASEGASAGRSHAATGLEVCIVNARHLPKVDILGSCDCYCVVAWDGAEYKTSIKKNQLRPEWNESFEFEVVDGELPALCHVHHGITVVDWNRAFCLTFFTGFTHDTGRPASTDMCVTVVDWNRLSADRVIGYDRCVSSNTGFTDIHIYLNVCMMYVYIHIYVQIDMYKICF